MKRTVLFLCTGDTCRGPMAAGLTMKLLQDIGVRDIDVRSAGVMTVNGLLATAETLQMLKGASVSLDRHRSTPVSVDLLRKCDLILGMTPLHVQHALRMAPDIKGRVYLLKEYARSDLKKVQIDDPMGNTLEVYKKVFSEIRSACVKFVKLPYVTGKTDAKAATSARNSRKRPAAKPVAKKVAASRKSSNGAAAPVASAKASAAAPGPVKKRAKAPAAKASSPAPPKAKTKPTGKPTTKSAGRAG